MKLQSPGKVQQCLDSQQSTQAPPSPPTRSSTVDELGLGSTNETSSVSVMMVFFVSYHTSHGQ